MDKLVTIASFSDPIKANLRKAKLESEGIPCVLADENMVSIIPIYSLAIGNIKLKVHELNAERAIRFLKSSDPVLVDDFKLMEENKESSSLKCPNCISTNLYKEELSKKSILGFLLLGFPIPIFRKRFHCFDCGYEWKHRS